jgi:hypothetical protein
MTIEFTMKYESFFIETQRTVSACVRNEYIRSYFVGRPSRLTTIELDKHDFCTQ